MNESQFHDLISGRTRGIVPALLRGALTGLSCGYRVGVCLRNWAFDVGLKPIHKAAVPVISVGNVTTGGTGKTPFVAFLANWLTQQQQQQQVVLLSRGYRALPGEVNDEKLVLNQLCPGLPHLQQPNRVASAKTACEEHNADILLLDDGFQHRKLHRDLNIVLIDTLNPFGYDKLLPRGLLREPVSALKRADLIVLTRADQCSTKAIDNITAQVAAVRGTDAHVTISYPPTELTNTQQVSTSLSTFQHQKIAACCGIGNPESFRDLLLKNYFDVVLFHPFPDHHHFTAAEINQFAEEAKRVDATAILTTQKDLVKLKQTEYAGLPLWAVKIEAKVLTGEELLFAKLRDIVQQ